MKADRLAAWVLGVGVVTALSGCARFPFSLFGDKPPVEPDAAKAEPVTEAPARPEPPRDMLRRAHLKFRDAREMTDYLALDGKRKESVENLRATQRMLLEKLAEIQEANRLLEKEFGIGARTQWDPETKTLYEEEGGEEDGPAPTRRVVKTVTDGEMEARLVRLLSAARAARNEAAVLQNAFTRRQRELEQIHQALVEDYAMARDREYELDPKTRVLYEKVRQPARFEVFGERK